MTSGKTRPIRQQEAMEGGKILNLHTLIFLNYTDSLLLCNTTTITTMLDIITTIKPSILYIPHQYDNHRDHMTTYTICSKAIYKLKFKIDLILCYKVWTDLKKVTYKIDITNFFDLKLQAIQKHKSQLIKYNYIFLINLDYKQSGGFECFDIFSL